jgi:RNase P subunit RPR2
MRPLFFATILLAAVPAGASDKLPTPASAEVCGRCHRAISEAWKTSVHADAMESRIFQDALEAAEGRFGIDARKICLGCHAPLAVSTNDLGLVRKTSWEGVTCDYCHSIRSVDVSGPNPRAVVDVSNVKSGPSKDAASPAHATAFSEVHLTALACAGCHEYRNALGFPVVTTYTEWKKGPSGKAGVPCQRCHMYLVSGNAVEPRVNREASHTVNLHEMPGSHSISQLNKALSAKLTATRDGDRVDVAVRLTNQGVGHDFPTGSPMRQLILEVRATPAGGDAQHASRIFTRTLAEASGAPIEQEYVAFMRAAKVLSDTRLAPGETRVEKFSFAIPASRPADIDASFYYFHPTASEVQESKRIKFLGLTQRLP